MPKASRAQPEPRIRNIDYTDRELLGVIDRAADGDGMASTTEIALALGFTDSKKYKTPAIKVASRLSWMRSGRLLESADPDLSRPYTEPGARDTRWGLTPAGRAIMEGQLSKAAQNAIEKMDDGAQILMMRHLTRKGFVEGSVPLAFAIRREYQHNIDKRKLTLR